MHRIYKFYDMYPLNVQYIKTWCNSHLFYKGIVFPEHLPGMEHSMMMLIMIVCCLSLRVHLVRSAPITIRPVAWLEHLLRLITWWFSPIEFNNTIGLNAACAIWVKNFSLCEHELELGYGLFEKNFCVDYFSCLGLWCCSEWPFTAAR